jgi:hypothetical protein
VPSCRAGRELHAGVACEWRGRCWRDSSGQVVGARAAGCLEPALCRGPAGSLTSRLKPRSWRSSLQMGGLPVLARLSPSEAAEGGVAGEARVRRRPAVIANTMPMIANAMPTQYDTRVRRRPGTGGWRACGMLRGGLRGGARRRGPADPRSRRGAGDLAGRRALRLASSVRCARGLARGPCASPPPVSRLRPPCAGRRLGQLVLQRVGLGAGRGRGLHDAPRGAAAGRT